MGNDMKSRFQRLGMQKRIMLYVAAGLIFLFGGFALVGFLSVREATQLVFEERLATAYTVAGILDRDFLHVARDVHEVLDGFGIKGDAELEVAARELFVHLSETDPFPFFQITGVWFITDDGGVKAMAGQPEVPFADQTAAVVSWSTRMDAPFAVIPAVGALPDAVPFATMLVRINDPAASGTFLVAVHTASINSAEAYRPDAYWRTESGLESTTEQGANSEAKYYLEVVDANGLAVLAIGEEGNPGEISGHFPLIRDLMKRGEAAGVLHEPAFGEAFSGHVMAVVPLGSSSFYILLEQPEDIALAIPGELRKRNLLATTLGFAAAILGSWWITRRLVVKPTRQLTAAAQRMSMGDLDTPINVSARDEIETLAASLEKMRTQLRDAYQGVSSAKSEAEGLVKQRTSRLTELLGKVISAQEQERRRLSRELHDETAQTIGALSIALDRARYGLTETAGESIEHIKDAQSIVKRLLEDMRRLISDLRPLALEDLGLVPAIRWYAETHLQEHGVETVVEADQSEVRMPPHLETALFRIVQEAINNVARHSGARHARIRLSFPDSMARLLVEDDGKGFNTDRNAGFGSSESSFGLLGMEERARLLNGCLSIHSEAGRGTKVVVEVPIPSVEEGRT